MNLKPRFEILGYFQTKGVWLVLDCSQGISLTMVFPLRKTRDKHQKSQTLSELVENLGIRSRRKNLGAMTNDSWIV